MTTYPKANRTAQWFGNTYGSTSWTHPDKGTLHSTETMGWPGYKGGASAPNYTARPNFTTKVLDFRAHYEDQESSRALVNLSGGVATNTDKNIQVELIGTCDPKHKISWNGQGTYRHGVHYLYWPAAPDWALKSLAEFIKYMNTKHGIPLSGASFWQAYPASYGSTGNRFTAAEWNNFKGWCGHQHVPENTHGDPGNINFAKIISMAKAVGSTPPPVVKPPPPVEEDDMPLNAIDLAAIRKLIREELDKKETAISVHTRHPIVKDTRTGTDGSGLPRVSPSTLLEAAAKGTEPIDG